MRFLAFAAILWIYAGPVAAETPDPAHIAAVETTGARGWDAAYSRANGDAVTRDVITWLRLREGDAPFTSYIEFVATRGDWPGLERLRMRGEEAIRKGHDPADVKAWFADNPPNTGEGAVRLAEALMTTGEVKQAESVLRRAWLNLGLTREGHDALMAAFPDLLAPYHAARTDALLWRSRTTDARRMLPILDADQRALAAARIGYISNARNLDRLIVAVPDYLQADAGLAFARYTWLADRGRREEAVAILLERTNSRSMLGEPFRWSGWRRSLVRLEMREGRAAQAYILASRHFLRDGTAYVDLEWLSGYISLTYLNNPDQALAHFENAARYVGSPISVARMQYWIGRAHAALDVPAAAHEAFALAAQHQTTFYGLLAAERLGLPLDPVLTGQVEVGDWENAPILTDDMTRAALLLLAAGRRNDAMLFFTVLGGTRSGQELLQLGALLEKMEEPYITILISKAAALRGIVMPSLYFPLHDLAELDLPIRPALAMSIARRESEFNVGAGSPVGALGMMQLMPATAREVAGFLELPYSRRRLTTDWQYNATLGSKYLAILEEEFGYSPVMVAAGYNAGPSRPNIWMDDLGDPRIGEIDIVDWIEHIPFRETRNYVMRVTESIPIYEARLSGQAGEIDFTTLLIGIKPLLRPQARPTIFPPVPEPDVRPIARPARG